MESQREKVLQYMRDFGSIYPQQAFFDLGVMRLAARISDLKKRVTKSANAGFAVKTDTAKT